DDIECVNATDPNWLQPDIADQRLRRVPRNAFLGGVEEVGRHAADDRVGEVLPAEGIERTYRVGAVGEFVERVELARPLYVVRRVDDDLAREIAAEQGDQVLRCRSGYGEHDDLGARDCVRDRGRAGLARLADAVDNVVARSGPLAAQRTTYVPRSDDRDS